MIPINPAVIKAVKGIVTVVGPGVLKYQKGNHGSKVKRGAYQDCEIDMFGDKACIVVDSDGSEIVLLTSEYIESYKFVEEKFRKKKMKTYYYYEIYFKDGQKSYVRMSKKYRDAMLNYL